MPAADTERRPCEHATQVSQRGACGIDRLTLAATQSFADSVENSLQRFVFAEHVVYCAAAAQELRLRGSNRELNLEAISGSVRCIASPGTSHCSA